MKRRLDGVAENGTATLLDPYLYTCGGYATANRGKSFIDPGRLPPYVPALDALDAVEAARAADGPGDTRPHLAHLHVMHPADVPRFARLGATADIQPLRAAHEPQLDEPTIPFPGAERAGWQ